MRIVIQRVVEASVTIEGKIHGKIGCGLLVLLGIESEDTQEDIDWLVGKIACLRIFADLEDKMNLSLSDVEGEVLVISQFTLHASTKKGNRPSYIRSAPPEVAEPLYQAFVRTLEVAIGKTVPTGIFGADMKVALVNDGPVTISIDSKRRE
ncbi:D-aminoacyl-tRNA deacylase [Verrucomicrobia bacterium]|jgi:D-tyrosyl-tRNA(Tyr) deacylase|nr:D-aminoacyl-tRNA deacylase [Verrucomicrobiota bacterium]